MKVIKKKQRRTRARAAGRRPARDSHCVLARPPQHRQDGQGLRDSSTTSSWSPSSAATSSTSCARRRLEPAGQRRPTPRLLPLLRKHLRFSTTVDLLSNLQSWTNEGTAAGSASCSMFKYPRRGHHARRHEPNVLLSEKPPSRVAQPVPGVPDQGAKRPRARRAPAPSTRARRENTPRSPSARARALRSRADLRLRLRAPRRQELEEDAERDGREARVRHAQLPRA